MAHSCHTSKRTKIYFPKMRCTEFPIIYSKSFWSSLLRRQLVVFWSLQIFVRDIFLISQKMWLWICSLHIHEFETANVQCVWASCTPLVIIIIIISYIFNFRPFEEHGWLLGLVWQRSGTLARLVYSFVCVHFAQSIQSVQNTCECVCVCLSHSLSVAYFILAILFTVSDECISSFVTSFSASCDLFLSLSLFTCSFYLHRVITHFSFTLDSLLLLPQNEQHLLLTAKRWIENRWEYLFLSCKFSSKVLEMATAGLACFWVC